jgi:hypothetical protein
MLIDPNVNLSGRLCAKLQWPSWGKGVIEPSHRVSRMWSLMRLYKRLRVEMFLLPLPPLGGFASPTLYAGPACGLAVSL